MQDPTVDIVNALRNIDKKLTFLTRAMVGVELQLVDLNRRNEVRRPATKEEIDGRLKEFAGIIQARPAP